MKRIAFHPLLFGIYPVIALLSYNSNQIKNSAALRSLFVSLILTLLLYGALKLLLRDWKQAAIICSLFMILFFSYGHIYGFLEKRAVLGIILGRHRLLIPLWLAIAVSGVVLTLRKRNLSEVTAALNIIGVFLIVFPLFQLLSFMLRTSDIWWKQLTPTHTIGITKVQDTQTKPDIYYIILDAYARDDVLLEEFNFDNSSFLDELTEFGFNVANCTQSNYSQSELSLASSLNYEYLNSLGDDFNSGNSDRSELWPLIRQSAVRQTLEKLGYTIVAFETGYYWTHIDDADVYFSHGTKALGVGEQIKSLNGFEVLLVKTSAGIILLDIASVIPDFLQLDLDSPKHQHRDRVLYTLDKLKSIPTSIQSPKFVFAHIVAPHTPFVFGPDGESIITSEPMDDETYINGYRYQVTYINKRVKMVIQEIIEVSATPPIIVIQADHGHDWASNESRMKIFNAYYLPFGGDVEFYESISPVNTFRIIFNYYFGADLELLNDLSFYSTYQDPYNFETISYPQEGCRDY
jgi:hypothetical protein